MTSSGGIVEATTMNSEDNDNDDNTEILPRPLALTRNLYQHHQYCQYIN